MNDKTSQNRPNGFTLLELMVVVVLVAILVTIAVPSYKRSIAKSDRSLAISDINKISQALERNYSLAQPRAYNKSFIDLGLGGDADTLASNNNDYNYVISHPANDTQTYLIQATPNLSTDTWTLRLNHLGQKFKKNSSDTGFAAGWPN